MKITFTKPIIQKNLGEFFELGRMLPLPGAITSQLDKVTAFLINGTVRVISSEP